METEDKKKKGLLEEYYKAEAEEMAGKPWYIRHKVTLIMGIVWVAFAIFCIVWNHYFPNGIF